MGSKSSKLHSAKDKESSNFTIETNMNDDNCKQHRNPMLSGISHLKNSGSSRMTLQQHTFKTSTSYHSTTASTIFQQHREQTLFETMEEQHQRAGLFCFISKDLCLYMLKFMDMTSVNTLGQTCWFWNILSKDNSYYRSQCVMRFHLDTLLHQKRLSFESFETSWRDVYVRLDSSQTSWKGFAMDRATNQFDPYPMEWILSSQEPGQMVYGLPKSVSGASFDGLKQKSSKQKNGNVMLGKPKWREQNVHGVCRWVSLKDSLTKSVGLVIDDLSFEKSRFDIDPWLETTNVRMVMFEETEIIRGSNIAVPNKYYGMMVGPLMMGVFDPGHPAFVGVFALLMEEATPRLMKQSSNPDMKHYNGQSINKNPPSPTSMSSSPTTSLVAPPNQALPVTTIPYHLPETLKQYRGLMTFANPLQRRGFHCSFKPINIQNNHTLFKGEFMIHFEAPTTVKPYQGTFIRLILTIDLSSTTIQPETNSRNQQDDAETIASVEHPYYKASRLASGQFEFPINNINTSIHTAIERNVINIDLHGQQLQPDDREEQSQPRPHLHPTGALLQSVVQPNHHSHEEEVDTFMEEQMNWVRHNLPLNQTFGMYRMGDFWVAYLREPKAGIFFIHIR